MKKLKIFLDLLPFIIFLPLVSFLTANNEKELLYFTILVVLFSSPFFIIKFFLLVIIKKELPPTSFNGIPINKQTQKLTNFILNLFAIGIGLAIPFVLTTVLSVMMSMVVNPDCVYVEAGNGMQLVCPGDPINFTGAIREFFSVTLPSIPIFIYALAIGWHILDTVTQIFLKYSKKELHLGMITGEVPNVIWYGIGFFVAAMFKSYIALFLCFFGVKFLFTLLMIFGQIWEINLSKK